MGGHEVVLRTSGQWVNVIIFALPQKSKETIKGKWGGIKGDKGEGNGGKIPLLYPPPPPSKKQTKHIYMYNYINSFRLVNVPV